jgi:hypothetical protein
MRVGRRKSAAEQKQEQEQKQKPIERRKEY